VRQKEESDIPKIIGTMIKFDVERRFGFIEPNHRSPNIFVHISDITGFESQTKIVGSKVEYKIKVQRDGRTKAVHVHCMYYTVTVYTGFHINRINGLISPKIKSCVLVFVLRFWK